jgi:hypothetical protein
MSPTAKSPREQAVEVVKELAIEAEWCLKHQRWPGRPIEMIEKVAVDAQLDNGPCDRLDFDYEGLAEGLREEFGVDAEVGESPESPRTWRELAPALRAAVMEYRVENRDRFTDPTAEPVENVREVQ